MDVEPRLKMRKGEDPFELIGGMEGCWELSRAFHARVGVDRLLAPLFPRNFAPSTERFVLFLAERLGGPAEYRAKRGKTSLRCRHAHLAIGVAERERWLELMFEAMDACRETGSAFNSDPGESGESVREILRQYFTETAHFLSDGLLAYYDLPFEELRAAVERDPHLLEADDTGRSLLAKAAFQWDVERVRLLLELGADVHASGRLGHDALYEATRPGLYRAKELDGCEVVGLLLRSGAEPNRRSGPGQCAALHNCARRGHVLIAQVLLKAGADVKAKDSKGATPLQRAVNCRQKAVAELLRE